jgi:hypothetical protein
MAKRIKPSQEIENIIPTDKYVSIHIRGTDKFSTDETDAISHTKEQFEDIKNKCIEYVKNNLDKKYFICTDDEDVKNMFIKECGNVNLIKLNYGDLDKAIVDMFVMSKSELVIQCTKYSTFSLVASLIGGIPLLNFNDSDKMGGNTWNWKPVLFKNDEKNSI